MRSFYTYAYIDCNGIPYYIGKGCGVRAWKKHSNIQVPPRNRVLILKENLSEEDAFCHEKYMIHVIGRLDNGTGPLLNKTAGGQGTSGKVWTEQERDRVRSEKLDSKWWNNGKQNTQSRECPGEGWKEGRLVTWDEEKRLLKMSDSASKTVYRLTHESGVVAYVRNLRGLGLACGYDLAFYKVMSGYRDSYKGWVSVEQDKEGGQEINESIVIDLCKKHENRLYKITNKDGSVMFTANLFELGRQFGTKDGFHRVYTGKRKSYKGWISVELVEGG